MMGDEWIELESAIMTVMLSIQRQFAEAEQEIAWRQRGVDDYANGVTQCPYHGKQGRLWMQGWLFAYNADQGTIELEGKG